MAEISEIILKRKCLLNFREPTRAEMQKDNGKVNES